MSRKITKYDLVTAFARTEIHRQQIQSFFYGDGETAIGEHVVRDLICDPARQKIWSAHDEDGSNYIRLSDASNVAIEERRMQLVANELNTILQNRRTL